MPAMGKPGVAKTTGKPRLSPLSTLPILKEQQRQFVCALLSSAQPKSELDIQVNNPSSPTTQDDKGGRPMSVAPNEAPAMAKQDDNASMHADSNMGNQLVTSIQGVFHTAASVTSELGQFVKFWVNKPEDPTSHSRTPSVAAAPAPEIDRTMGMIIKSRRGKDKYDLMGNSLLDTVVTTQRQESSSSVVTKSSSVLVTDKHGDSLMNSQLVKDWLTVAAHESTLVAGSYT